MTLVAPLFAAVAFVIPESYQSMHRPDSIYIPGFHEVLLFTVAYLIFGLINAAAIVPIANWFAARRPNHVSTILFALGVAVVCTLIVYATGILGNKPSIIHKAYIFGVFIPLLVVTSVSIHFALKDITENEQ